jgi:phage shock protein C
MIQDNATPHRLYRSRGDKMVAGVAGGLGQYFNIDPVLVRLAFVALTFWGCIGLPLYIVLAIVVPKRPLGEAETPVTFNFDTSRAREITGLALAGFGALLLVGNLGWGSAFWNVFNGHVFWPVVLIVIGAVLLLRQRD